MSYLPYLLIYAKVEEIKCNTIIKEYENTKENIKGHNPNWPQTPDHPYRILIIGGSESEKTTSLFNLISHQPDIDKIYLYAKDPYEAKYQFFEEKKQA